jgi:translation initiation factor 2 alpha subunit (eIF-2alpha)
MEEGDLVLCTVEKVSNTITQVRLPDGREGTIISSEIAPGRIKHMRQYVVPNKKIVCKVLGISGANIQLSLRRVNTKEKNEVMEKWKTEQATNVAFRQILGKDEERIKGAILEDFKEITDFIEAIKKDEKILDKYVPKENREALKTALNKKKRNQELKQNIKVTCLQSDGVKKIKDIFDIKAENASVTYISAGNFKLKLNVEDFKQGKKQMTEILEEMEKKAKKYGCEFYSTEDK